MSVEVVTFGCRLNISESEAIERLAVASRLQNVVILNTCAVTAEATRKARQAIRRIKKERPDADIIVTGCAAQIKPDDFAAMPEVSSIIGNDEKMKAEVWDALKTSRTSKMPDFGISDTERVLVNDIFSVKETAFHLYEGMKGHTRGFVQVQNGCDHRCTFCIIPYGRGNSRSVPVAQVVEQVRLLVENGTLEIVLTGVDLTSYGVDLPGSPKLGHLVKAILRHVPELPRLRISSIDSIEADDDLIDAIAHEKRVMPHIHLSLQSGDDVILKRMKRRHSRGQAIEFCAQIRQLRPDIVFGADVIVGFPTETDAMFQRSLDLVDECGITHLHVFPFSAREGTPAARMPKVTGVDIKNRARILREKGRLKVEKHLAELVGSRQSVLTEAGNVGRTEDFTLVRFMNAVQSGLLVECIIAGHAHDELIAL